MKHSSLCSAQGKHEEIPFDGIEINGYLLTALNGSLAQDEDILYIILPYVRNWKEQGQIKAFLEELR